MSKPCRLTFFAYMLSEVQANAYDKRDLENGIEYAKDLMDVGFSHEPHDRFSLRGYINWCITEIRRIA